MQDEEGYILYVKKNALQILIPKYGLEGTLYLNPPKGVQQTITFTYNDEVSRMNIAKNSFCNKFDVFFCFHFVCVCRIIRKRIRILFFICSIR